MASEPTTAASVRELVEGDTCPTCGTSPVILCECGQGDPAEHLICLGCGEDPPWCDCKVRRDA